uniref:Uncharacterized protein n=1 Tax=Lotharella oceanica TaxID=641309 RepID=A0A7S2TP86_9EUKA|mmetsp:Transcript_20600/g.38747  ORF Transcript_20600/g.38747 Transcript_20600/m.38747 type:complete len:208 (+) Transcript_20600:100-723(+)
MSDSSSSSIPPPGSSLRPRHGGQAADGASRKEPAERAEGKQRAAAALLPGKDGTFDGCVLPPECYRVLFAVSFLIVLPSLYGFVRGHVDLALASTLVFLTSVNYWRRPDYGWRRYLDITVAHFMAVFHWLRSLDSPNYALFNAIFLVGVLAFAAGCAIYHPDRLWESTLLHATCHLLGNVSNLVLYSSDIEKLGEAWFVVGRMPDFS